MRVVIQCAGRKNPQAGTFRWEDRRVTCVAQPDLARGARSRLFVHPDDSIPSGEMTWRELLVRYNATARNPDQLLQAADLYVPPIYRELASTFGRERFYILSAGWGLVRSDYLLPDYDVTLAAAEAWKMRKTGARFEDFNHLEGDVTLRTDQWLVFFGTRDYEELFRRLTRQLHVKKLLWRRVDSKNNEGLDPWRDSAIDLEGFAVSVFRTSARTNWHYRCAADFIREWRDSR